MTIQTSTRTFSKATKKQIAGLFPTARTFKAVGRDFIIRDAEGRGVCTWHFQTKGRNGILVTL